MNFKSAKTRSVFLLLLSLNFLYLIKLYYLKPNVIFVQRNPIANASELKNQVYLNLKSGCPCRRPELIYTAAEGATSSETFTCDLYKSLRRGKHQKVISYSLYGTNQYYYSNLKHVVKLIAKYYPGWVMRVYHDESINRDTICELECLRNDFNDSYYDIVDFCDITKIPSSSFNATWNAKYMHSMKWRFLPIGDSFVDMFMSRDTDSWIVDREFESVKVWWESNTLFHIMRDNPQHNVPILGGMWGFANMRNRVLGNDLYSILIDKSVSRIFNKNGQSPKMSDQYFLDDMFWKYAKENATIHDSFHCESYGGSAFPSKRPETDCFAACIDCCDHKLYNKTWTFRCPKACRPKDHQDWIYC